MVFIVIVLLIIIAILIPIISEGVMRVVLYFITIFLFTATLFTIVEQHNEQNAINEAISTISAGTVVDKQIATSGATLFRETSINFLIIVSGEVEYNDELHTAEKTFTVTEDIYNRYSVGDWFDSKNLITSEQQFANGE